MILQELFEAGPGGSDNYAENLAQQVFNVRPNLRSEDDVLNIGYKVAVQDLASQTRAMSLFSRDQDFPSDFVSAYYYLQKQKPGDQGLNEFAPGAGGGDDGDADPYRYPKPESYRRSADYFGQFEADHFDREDFDDATGVFKGYWDNTQIAYFKFDTPAKTGSDDSGMGWYYEPDSDNGADTSANPAVDNSAQRKQQELSMIDAFLKSGQTPKPGSQIYGLMKRHGILENSLNEFAPGSDGGESGHWYTDDELADIIGDDWFEDFDVSNDGFNIDAYGEKAKKNLVGHANAWFDDRGYNVNVLGVEHNDVDHDLKWYIVGSFQNDNFAKKDVPENSYKNSQAYRADGGANDEDHEGDARREKIEKSGAWYIRLNGKLIKDKTGNPYSFRGKAAANKAALTMQAKLFNQGKEFMLTTNPNDKPQGVAEVAGTSPDRLMARTGMNLPHKFPRTGQTNLGNIPGTNLPDSSEQTKKYGQEQRANRPDNLKAAIRDQLGKHNRPNLPEQGVAEGVAEAMYDPSDDDSHDYGTDLLVTIRRLYVSARDGKDPSEQFVSLNRMKDGIAQSEEPRLQQSYNFLMKNLAGGAVTDPKMIMQIADKAHQMFHPSLEPIAQATREAVDRSQKQGVAEESSENKYANLSNRGVNRGIKRAGDDFNRLLDLDQAESPHYKTQHQQDTKQRLKTKPMAGPKGVLPEQGVAEGQGRDKHYYLRNDIWRVMDGDELVHEYTPERYEVVGAKKLLARFDDEGYDVTHVISPMGTVTYLYGKPEMDEGFDGEYDDEAGMADNNLETLKRAVQGIDDVINTGDNLPEWCQEKIAVSKSMLVSVWDYMRSEKEKN